MTDDKNKKCKHWTSRSTDAFNQTNFHFGLLLFPCSYVCGKNILFRSYSAQHFGRAKLHKSINATHNTHACTTKPYRNTHTHTFAYTHRVWSPTWRHTGCRGRTSLSVPPHSVSPERASCTGRAELAPQQRWNYANSTPRTARFHTRSPWRLCNIKVCPYVVQYLVRWTAHSTLHFTPWQTSSFRHQLDFSGKHSSNAAITRQDYSLTV